MDEQLQKALADILTTLKTGAEQISAGATEQVPLLVREYLAWGFWRGVLLGVVFLFVALLAMRIRARLLPHFRARVEAEEQKGGERRYYAACDLQSARANLAIVGHVLPCVVAAISVSLALMSLHTSLQITIAPRVYLLETVTALVK